MAEHDTKRLGAILKNARKAAGLTQAEVANRLGITYQAISNYERGVNNIDSVTLFKLTDMYNISAADLIDEIDYSVIAEKLKSARRASGLTQQAVATTLGLSVSLLRECESGKREIEIDLLRQLCTLYGIKISTLISKKNVIHFSKNVVYFSPIGTTVGKEKFEQHMSDLRKAVNNLNNLILDTSPNDEHRAYRVEISIQVTEDFELSEWHKSFNEGKAGIIVTDNNSLKLAYKEN